jgi:transposase-like protein
VIQLNDNQYWLYAAVNPDSNDLLHTKLEPTRTNVIADQFFAKLCEKHDVDDTIFLVDGAAPLQRTCDKHDLNFRYERRGNRNSVERVFREVKRRTISFSNFSATPKQKLLMSGSDRSHSHGISLFVHYRFRHAKVDTIVSSIARCPLYQ